MPEECNRVGEVRLEQFAVFLVDAPRIARVGRNEEGSRAISEPELGVGGGKQLGELRLALLAEVSSEEVVSLDLLVPDIIERFAPYIYQNEPSSWP